MQKCRSKTLSKTNYDMTCHHDFPYLSYYLSFVQKQKDKQKEKQKEAPVEDTKNKSKRPDLKAISKASCNCTHQASRTFSCYCLVNHFLPVQCSTKDSISDIA